MKQFSRKRLTAAGLGAALSLASGAALAQYGLNVVIVNATPGNAVASCNSLTSALAGITSPSASHRFLVKLGPGEYDCGSQTITMQEYVDIEGSGIETTKLLWQGVTTPSSGDPAPLFVGADHAELRMMSVKVNGISGRSATVIRNTGTSPRITRMKIELEGADHCVAIDSMGSNGDPNANPPIPADPIATPYLRELEIVAKCEIDNTGLRILGRANPIIQRDYIKAVLGTGSNIGIQVAMEGVPTQQGKEARDLIISAYGPNGEDTATAIGIQFLPGSGDFEELNTYKLFQSYVHAGNADTTRGITLEGAADGSSLKPKLNVYKSQVISKQDFGALVRGATLILHSSVVESGKAAGEAEISAETQTGATDTGSTVRVGATHLREGTILKDTASTVACASVYDKNFVDVTCP